MLSEIKCETQSGDVINAGTTNNRLNVLYSYDENNNLISVTYPDGKCAEYDYENNNLVKVCNINPNDILCISFTNDATINLKNNILISKEMLTFLLTSFCFAKSATFWKSSFAPPHSAALIAI